MEKLTQRCIQSEHFLPKSEHFFDFQKKKREASPSSSDSCMPVFGTQAEKLHEFTQNRNIQIFKIHGSISITKDVTAYTKSAVFCKYFD